MSGFFLHQKLLYEYLPSIIGESHQETAGKEKQISPAGEVKVLLQEWYQSNIFVICLEQ